MLTWIRRILLGLVAVLVLAVAAGVGWEQWSRSGTADAFPPPGRLIEHEGRLSHLHCTGEGTPTVVLEAGLGVAGSRSWRRVQPEIALRTRVCSYDRAGVMWSEPRQEPRDARRIVRELHGLLEAASEPPPYVLVGHSLGGLLARVYADRHPDEVAGLVLVDASHPGQLEAFPPAFVEARTRREEALPPRRLFRLWADVGGFRLLRPPPENAVQAYLWRSAPWGVLGEIAAREAIREQADGTETLGDRPLVVLTAGEASSVEGVPDEALERAHGVWQKLQAELAALSTDAEHRIVEGAGHNLHREDPEAVIGAVRDVVAAAREGTPVSGTEEEPDP